MPPSTPSTPEDENTDFPDAQVNPIQQSIDCLALEALDYLSDNEEDHAAPGIIGALRANGEDSDIEPDEQEWASSIPSWLSQKERIATTASALAHTSLEPYTQPVDECTANLIESLDQDSHALSQLLSISAGKQLVLDEVLATFDKVPEILPELQSRSHAFGAPTTKMVSTANDNVRRANDHIKALAGELAQLRLENSRLRVMQEASQDHLQFDQQTTISSIATDHTMLFMLLGITDREKATLDHSAFEAEFQDALAFFHELGNNDYATSAPEWLNRIQGLTSPRRSTKGLRDLSVWLFFQSCTKTPSAGTLADLHALAASMHSLSAPEIRQVLAFLLSFLRQIASDITKKAKCSVNRALIVLRAIELLCDFIRPIRFLAEVDTILRKIKPSLENACQESRLVRGFTTLLENRLNTNPNLSLADILISQATKDQPDYIEGPSTIFMDLQRLIIIDDSGVHVIQPDNCRMLATPGRGGWTLETEGYPNPGGPWWSSPLLIGDDDDLVFRLFDPLLDRLAEDNVPVELSEEEAFFSDKS